MVKNECIFWDVSVVAGLIFWWSVTSVKPSLMFGLISVVNKSQV